MKTRHFSFDLFRYQILPKSRDFQRSLFDNVSSLNDLLAKKNEMFFKTLLTIKRFKTPKTAIRHEILHQDKNSILYRFASSRSLTRETENFTAEEIPNWPSFYVYVWNAPEKQFIAIQERPCAFRQTEVVAKAMASAINFKLGEYQLRTYIKAVFLENAFWDLAKRNAGKIKDIRFELITPNMSNISAVLSDDLKEFAKKTNTAQTTLGIQADPDSAISVDSNDKDLKGLVKYSSEGGGNISVKIKGLSKRLQTKKSKKRIDINELELKANDPAQMADAIKKLLS